MSAGLVEAVHLSFPDEPVERDLVLREGSVPADLRGTLVRNGPGLVRIGDDLLHLLDGHALLATASFGRDRPRLRARHVETPWLAAERKAGRMVHRRLFTNLPGRFSNLLKIDRAGGAGHDVHAWAGRLIATDDHHFAVDPVTLETERHVRWDDRKLAHCPMPRPDPETGRLVGYLLKEGGLRPDQLTFVELDRGLRVLSRSKPHTLPGSPVIVHDVAFTPRWYVVTEAAARLSPLSALGGRRTLFQSFGWPDGLTLAVTLVARPDGERAVRVLLPAPAKACFHVANAHDDGDDRVVVDLVVYDGPVDFDQLGPPDLRALWGTKPSAGVPPRLRRVVIDTATGELVSVRDLGTVPLELPEIDARLHGRPHRVIYGATPGTASGTETDPLAFPFFHGVARVEVATGATTVWDAGPHRLVSQPAFAPRDDGEGWLLAWVHDAERGETDVVVLDAADPSRGPVAVLATGAALPPSNHVLWTPLGA
jgi:all-trans-8'-apo-beta-carotenal 15,15'-oxygenase